MNVQSFAQRLRCSLTITMLLSSLTARQTFGNDKNIQGTAELALMPMPAQIEIQQGALAVDSAFRISFIGYNDARLKRAAQRAIEHLSQQTGILLNPAVGKNDQAATLQVECGGPAGRVQDAVEDESYQLTITRGRALLRAPRPYGVLRGLETFLQLVSAGAGVFSAPFVTISDAPRFPWRGLLIDVCRHWIPLEVLKRNLDAMAALKLNVLHWHLTEDQAFRIESKRFPTLHQKGSNGMYFTQAQVRELISYAADRGIRVIPEFDMPGHTTSWFIAHPELASAPGPYEVLQTWGVHDAAMDPTREEVYKFIDAFLGEMSSLFPDPYIHIGGDEVTGKHWNANPRIQQFMRGRRFAANGDLQAYFNRRVLKILRKHGKKMVGWDEILHPDLPHDIVVQSWRGQKSLAEATKKGYLGILSSGYYLDHMRPSSFHYAIDPYDTTAATLAPEEQARILGGEACMWAEFVTPENIDSRIWPRLGAIAERLWSPDVVGDIQDMYRRLNVVSQRLEWLGITHQWSYRRMLQRLADNKAVGPLRVLAEIVEPVKLYERLHTRMYTTETPLNRLVDAVWPESWVAREFGTLVDAFLADSLRKRNVEAIQSWLVKWQDNDERLQPLLSNSFLLAEIEPLSRDLSRVAAVGLKALAALRAGEGLASADRGQMTQVLENADKAHAELTLAINPSIRRLVVVASGESR